MRSITSLMSLGARMRLANMDLSLREPCPKRAQRGSEGRITVRGPEGHEVLGLTVGHAPQLDRRRRLGRYPVRLEEGRADLLGGDGLLVRRKHEPGGGPARREAGQVDDRGCHEGPVRHDDLPAVVGAQLRGPERDLFHRSAIPAHLDAVPDPKRPLDEDPHPREKVLENVLQREADHDANDAERCQDPSERALGVDRKDQKHTDDDDRELRQGAFGWILTSFSVVGIVIGLSLQDILKNFFAGVWVLVERPFRIGDTIEVSGHTGVVEEIAFRTTQLRTMDGREVIVPNGSFMTESVVNLTRFPTRRAAAWLVVPAEVSLSVDDVRGALAGAEGVSNEPPPTVELRGVADAKARYLVTFW